MLTAFPIKTRTIIASKFLSMYINNLAFAVVVMVPMAVGYEMWNGFNAGTVAFWFLWNIVRTTATYDNSRHCGNGNISHWRRL